MKDQLMQMLQGLGGQANTALSQAMQPYDEDQFQGLFKKAFIDPAMMNYEQNALPKIQERMMGMDQDASGSLNQALAQSAQDLSTGLGTQMGQFYQQQQGNQMDAMKLLASLFGIQTQQPIVRNSPSPFQQFSNFAGNAASSLSKFF